MEINGVKNKSIFVYPIAKLENKLSIERAAISIDPMLSQRQWYLEKGIQAFAILWARPL